MTQPKRKKKKKMIITMRVGHPHRYLSIIIIIIPRQPQTIRSCLVSSRKASPPPSSRAISHLFFSPNKTMGWVRQSHNWKTKLKTKKARSASLNWKLSNSSRNGLFYYREKIREKVNRNSMREIVRKRSKLKGKVSSKRSRSLKTK